MKKTLLAVMTTLLPLWASAEDVSSDVAEDAARGWINLRESLGGEITAEPESVLSYDAKDGKGKYYVVNLKGGGFVVTSGATELEPILAYSKEGVWNTNAAENPLMAMLNIDVAAMMAELCSTNSANTTESVQQQGGGLRLAGAGTASVQQQDGKAAKWARLRGAASAKGGLRLKGTTEEPVDLRVAPLVTTAWGQSYVNNNLCYNKYTPGNYVCGCVATMGAQLMRYWSWPDAAHKKANVRAYAGKVDDSDYDGAWNLSDGWKTAGSGSWTPWAVTPFDTSVPYDWSNMPDTPSANAHYDAIGRLTLDVGLAAGMHYESTGSGAGLCACARALVEQFAYQNMALRCNPWGTITTEEALNAMLSNFDAGLPCGVTISDPGHAIVGDGYGYDSSKTLYVHFNMGWYGTDTAWYTPPNVKCTHYGYEFTAINGVIYNLYPPTDKNGVSREPGLSIVSGTLLNDSGSPVGGVTVMATNLTTGAAITATSAASTGRFLLWLPAGYYKFSAASGGKNACRYENIKSVSDTINDEGGQTYPANGTVGNIHGFELTLNNQIPTIQDTASFWLDASDASTITTNANGEVTRWNSRVGSNYARPMHDNLASPLYDTTTYGKPTVDFGALGSGKDLGFDAIRNIRTFFMVVKIQKDIGAMWLTCADELHYEFARGEKSKNGAYAADYSKISRMWDGGAQVADIYNEYPSDTQFIVVAGEMSEDSTANSITCDRYNWGVNNRNGGKQLCELLVYNRVLSDAERIEVTEYLQEKWPTEKAATPTSPTATTFYTNSYTVTLECATAGSAIYYTVDGSEPTTNSALYAGPFTITDTTTVKAMAVARGYFDSEVFTQTFTLAPQAATPTSTSTAGYRNTLVDLATATPGATIRYTTDGSDPTAESPVYDGTINVTNRTGATTVKAVVFADGYRPSEVFTYDYYVKQFFGPTNGANVATWEDTPENRAAHWVHEDEDFKEATGLWSNAVEYVDHKVMIGERNEFTADNPSDARNVIIETTLSFDSETEGHEDYDGAKAAIRIGTNSCFQVYTTNTNGRVWLDAQGSLAETNRDYIVRLELDFTNKTYTVAVKNGSEYATLYDGAVTNFPFAYSDGAPYVQMFEFDGEGSVGSIYGSYTNRVVVFVTDEVVTVSDGTATLTASQAEWLNARGDHAAVAAMVRTLTSDQFARAYLLNENIMNASYSVDGWGSFEITDIDVGASAVTVKVKLVRNFAVMDGAKAAPINGTLKVYGGTDVTGINTQIQNYELNDNDLHFRDGEEATFIIDKGAIKFYKAVIE